MRRKSINCKAVLALCAAVILSLSPLCAAREGAHAASRAGITAPAAIMRLEPSPGAQARRILHAGAQVDVLSSVGDYLWVNAEGVSGFIPASSVAEDAPGSHSGVRRGHTGLLVTWLQNALRQAGYYEGDPTGFFGLNTDRAIKAFQKANGMREDGVAGAAAQEALIALTQTATATLASAASESVPYGTASRYSNLAPGSSGDAVLKLQQALYDKGLFTAAPTGEYDGTTEEAVKAFQERAGLWADGIAGKETQALIFSGAEASAAIARPLMAGALKPAAKSSVKKKGVWVLEWDDGDVERVFPRRTYATVIDARTGKRYQVRRFQGTNHADVEMVTREDTDTFISLLDDEWSWRARPIYLEIDGELYAAAMNGMPHGDITLLENGVGGHFCVHFVGSTTHISGESNEGMQAAIQEAIKLAPKYTK